MQEDLQIMRIKLLKVVLYSTSASKDFCNCCIELANESLAQRTRFVAPAEVAVRVTIIIKQHAVLGAIDIVRLINGPIRVDGEELTG